MPEEEKYTPPEENQDQQQPFLIDFEKFRMELDEFRASYRMFLDDSETSLNLASDANKQIAAFYERLLLVDLGTVGLSITALTSFTSKFSSPGFHKCTILILVSCGWILLLLSAFLCRAVMLQCISANKKLISEWIKITSDYHRQEISLAATRMARTMSGTLHIGNTTVDIPSFLADLTNLVNPATFEKAMGEFQSTLSPEGARKTISAGEQATSAIRLMQLGLALLGIAAVVLFASLT